MRSCAMVNGVGCAEMRWWSRRGAGLALAAAFAGAALLTDQGWPSAAAVDLVYVQHGDWVLVRGAQGTVEGRVSGLGACGFRAAVDEGQGRGADLVSVSGHGLQSAPAIGRGGMYAGAGGIGNPGGGLVKMDESGDHRLQTERGVWLCTLRPDGSAHITPVWFVYISDTWWIGCRATSVKVRNVRADPRVVLTLTDPDRPLVAQGLAEVHSAAEFPAVVMSAFMAKYDWNPATIDGSGASRVLVRVSGERWLMAGKPG